MIKNSVSALLEQEERIISRFGALLNMEVNKGCVDGTIIGTGRSDYTQGSTTYDLIVNNKTFALVDIPGIEGDERRFETIIKDSLDTAHTIFYVNGSGKKIEKATLEKIKKYMRDGTSVYAVFNVHCKAKKERIPEIDQSFSQELASAYMKQAEIIHQTESELKSFLGQNYKGSISLNGLLSFCGLAITNNRKTTIVDEKDKNLRTDQEKYLKEYSFDVDAMVKDGRIGTIVDTIKEKVDHFESYIYDENIKKLKSRLQLMCDKVEGLEKAEKIKIISFKNLYDEFESNCYNAKEDFIQTICHVGFNAASDAFADVKADLFQMVETQKGKTKDKDIQGYFDKHKDKIINDIQNNINTRISQAITDYDISINDARERLLKDFEREQIKFVISLPNNKLPLNNTLSDAFKYSWKTFKKDAFRAGSLAFSGGSIGSLFCPGIGTAIGAFAGAILGVLSSIWNWFASEESKINKAKSKINQAIEEQIEEVEKNIKEEMIRLDYESKIEESYIISDITEQSFVVFLSMKMVI